MRFQLISKVSQDRCTSFNRGWRFALADPTGAHEAGFDDAAWRGLDVPHDWSVEHPFDERLEGCTGYLPGGIGWYRKHFSLSHQAPGTRTVVVFDGVYNHGEFWLNGKPLGRHEYGYSPFYIDLTDHLAAAGRSNVLAVRVDHARYADSRWYTGSGIYRGVKLLQLPPVHIPVWGTFVTTPTATAESATIKLRTDVKNTGGQPISLQVTTKFIAPSGQLAATTENSLQVDADRTSEVIQCVELTDPQRWSPDTPVLYTAETTLTRGGELIDCVTTRFGIRDLRFDPDSGFFLNGDRTLIKGVCLHHDAGLVGAAVPRGVWERRLAKLKAAGCNAIRTAHNPASEDFLDLCDEMGFLVQDEFFDEWDLPKDKRRNMKEQERCFITDGYASQFRELSERDLKDTMRRDRNHPCVFQWSIGNEIEWTYPRHAHATGFFDMDWSGNYFWSPAPLGREEVQARYDAAEPDPYDCGETARRLAAWTRELDATRPVIANLILPSASYASGYADALDVAGFSYRRVMYDRAHAEHPDQPIMGTENLPQWHEWKAVLDRPFVAGVFLWTGIDYQGEANGKWPVKGAPSGLLDLAGFEKPAYHLFKTLWNDEPHVRLFTQPLSASEYEPSPDGHLVEKNPGSWAQRTWLWHDLNPYWDYEPGERVVVEAYTNCPAVTLMLNGRNLGIRRLADQDDRVCRWLVDYEPGELVVRCSSAEIDAEHRLETTGAPAGIELSIDRPSLEAGSPDVAHVVAQLVDHQGRPVRCHEREVVFEVGEALRVLGVDNGAIDSVQPYASDRVVTRHGRALLLVQATETTGEVPVVVNSGSLRGGSLSVTVSPRQAGDPAGHTGGETLASDGREASGGRPGPDRSRSHLAELF